jgi:hypothetical protein
MRRLIVVGIVLVAILVAADIGGRAVAQREAGDAIASTLGLDERPSVSLGGFPFLVRLALGSFPSASIEARGVSSHGVTLMDATLHLEDVRLVPRGIVFGGAGEVRARHGEGTARMTAAEASQALQASGTRATVQFEQGRVVISSPAFGSAQATAAVSNGSLVLRSADPSVPISLSIRLPQFISGLRYTGITVSPGTATLRVALDGAVIRVGGGS